MLKVTELINKGNPSFSFEVTPHVPTEVLDKLIVKPVFYSITWHAKTHQCKDLEIAPLKLSNYMRDKQMNVMLHLSCDMLTKTYLDTLLTKLQEVGVCNLFVVLGESYDPNTSEFKNTLELIKYIREKSGNYFCIGIAGMPECNDEKLLQMKEKIDNGADFVITQAFFEPYLYKNFVNKCEKNGIKVPIIPGVFPFDTIKQLDNFINICKIKVSDDFMNLVKNKDTEVLGLEVTLHLLRCLKDEFGVSHFHFFTLNKFETISRLANLL